VQQDSPGGLITITTRLSPANQLIDFNSIEQGVVMQFIRYARTVIADPTGQDTLLRWVDAHDAGAAKTFLREYYGEREHNPYVVAQKHSVAASITSIIPIGLHSWQVRLVEQYVDRNGARLDGMPDQHFVALAHTQISADPGKDLNNSEGIKIIGLQWAHETLPEGQK
jgi:type IV secretory pathway TrbF-like protein